MHGEEIGQADGVAAHQPRRLVSGVTLRVRIGRIVDAPTR
jgi:hypothetical protein